MENVSKRIAAENNSVKRLLNLVLSLFMNKSSK